MLIEGDFISRKKFEFKKFLNSIRCRCGLLFAVYSMMILVCMIGTLIFNNSYTTIKEDAETEFYTDFAELDGILKSYEDGIGKCIAALNIIDNNDKLTFSDYDKYLSSLPKTYFGRGNEFCGYFYALEDDNKISSWFYRSESGTLVDLYLSDSSDIFKDSNIEPNKWKHHKNKDGSSDYLVYTLPVIQSDNEIGYIGVVLNLYFIENSFFGDNCSDCCSLSFISKGGEVLFGSEFNSIGDIYTNNNEYIEDTYSLEEDNIISRQHGLNALLYKRISEDLILVEEIDILKYQQNSNTAVVFVSFMMFLSFFMFQERKDGESNVLTQICKKYFRGYKNPEVYKDELKYMSIFMFMVVMFFAIVLTLAYSLFTGYTLYPTIMLSCMTLINFLKLSITKINITESNLINIFVCALDICSALIPGVFLFFAGGLESTLSVYILIWSITIIAMGVFCRSFLKTIHTYYLTLSFLFAAQMLSVFVWKNTMDKDTFILIAYIAFIGLILNSAFILFKTHNDKNNQTMKSLVTKVKDTQDLMLQNERMATLGQLMAGISHEINTPIGAIKASADTFNTKLIDSFKIIIDDAKNYSEDDIEDMFKLINLSFDSVKKMLTTSDLRKAKEKVCDLLIQEGVQEEKAYNVAHMLSRIEICDLNKVHEILDMLKKDNIEDILKTICDIFFLITGTNTIQLATNKVSKIIYALRAYSNISVSNAVGEFNITECIDNILTLYTSQYNSAITINRFYQKEIPPVIGNAEGLGQVCTNIIQNAFYALKNGGTLNISVKFDEKNIFVDFADTGCGIAEENISKIFEPLFTTKPLGEGSGLGLGICKKIIENHNGSISVESEWEKGTVFSIQLPLTQNSASFKED